MENRLEKLNIFIQNYWGVDKSKLSFDTLIEDDLGISGDDAYEFIVAFKNNFNIDIDSFVFTDYFESEPSLLSCFKPAPIKRLSIKMLYDAIEEGKLI